MKPLRFALGEAFNYELYHSRRYAFDHLHREPKKDFKVKVSSRLPKDEYPEAGPFGNGPLLKSIGNFVIDINKALDKDNQIAVHIPDPQGLTVYIFGDNPWTVHHVKGSIDAILDSYVENRHDKNFHPHTVAAPEAKKTKRFFDCWTAFNSSSFIPAPKQPDAATPLPADELVTRYLQGVAVESLEHPEKDIAFASFDLDYGYIDTRVTEFDLYEQSQYRDNLPVCFEGEKDLSPQTGKAYAKFWDINSFEDGKAEYFQRFKSFIQNELGVTVSISPHKTGRVELSGHPDNVALAEKIGRRAVPLLNEGKPLPEIHGEPGKPLDKLWLKNALDDARYDVAVKKINKQLGVITPPKHTISRLAEPKDFPDFRLKGFVPA